MNQQRPLTRWNRFAIKKDKENTPEPHSPQLSARLHKQSTREDHSSNLGIRAQVSKTKDKLPLTSRYPNRQLISTSNCTKANFPQHPSQRQGFTRSKSKLRTQKSQSITKCLPCRQPKGKHKINYSILQRIHKILQQYPSLFNQCKPPYKETNFATKPLEEDSQGYDRQVINLNKLVLWRESKLIRSIEKIYEYLLNSEVNQGPPCWEGSGGELRLRGEIRSYLMERYKTSKLCLQNFINLCYSLYYYVDKAQYEWGVGGGSEERTKLRMLLVFQKFISFEYSEEDLIFYLYSRNILNNMLQKNIHMTLQHLTIFLNIISNDDSCIYKHYEAYLTRTLTDRQQYEVHSILYHLLSNFQSKKPKEATQSSKRQGETCEDGVFWRTDPPERESIKQQLYEVLLQEVGVQTKKLVSYFQQQFRSNKERAAELILIKAIRMLNTVHLMDKYRWFEEMQLVQDSVLMARPEDFAEIEALQSQLRTIEHTYPLGERRAIVQFAKKLLTAKALLGRLQELFEPCDNDPLQ